MLNIFERGRVKLGERAFSTSIVKILEDECKDDLRAEGFPSTLKDNTSKKKAEEIII